MSFPAIYDISCAPKTIKRFESLIKAIKEEISTKCEGWRGTDEENNPACCGHDLEITKIVSEDGDIGVECRCPNCHNLFRNIVSVKKRIYTSRT